jgi:non-ribosomal peptide synthetase component F
MMHLRPDENECVGVAAKSAVSSCLIQDLFLRQAGVTPDAPAVITTTRTLSYSELLARACAWGGRLRELGARPNTLVAVVMEKGWEQIVAVLGILESGAAYLPVDPGIPKERLWFLLENGEISTILTQSWVDTRHEWPPQVIRFCVDCEEPAAVDPRLLEHTQTPDDLAYVLYTSGSTGEPKGAAIAHRGLVNCILETNREFAVTANDRT